MFRIDERDISFTLWEHLGLEQQVLTLPAYAEMWDRATAESTLENAFKLAKEVLEPTNVAGDREGCRRDEQGNVFAPKGYKEAYDQYVGGGWIGLTVPPEHGGMGAPHTINAAASEAFIGANASLAMYPGLTHGAAALLIEHGSAEQKALYLEPMISGRWGGTMCLTEAGAGSAVGDSKSRASKVPGKDGWYRITGQKVFISSGDCDLVENTIHMVLARTPDAPAGVKGLSIFLVPKFLANPDGSKGPYNDVLCVGIEHKMGIKGSATCTLAFGENENCIGWILGNEGDGIKIMFQMMNEARLGVGMLGLGVAATAYNEALDYARERVQGVDMRNFKDPNAPRVPIIQHPDVRRMLMTMRAYVYGMRALLYRTARYADISFHGTDPEQKKLAAGLVELLTPVCKSFSTDKTFEVTDLAIQTFGGYGYCQEYPVEQYMRDCKIFTIYEGTNGIQAMDLVGRKLGMKGGSIFMGFIGELQAFVETAKAHPATAAWAGELEQSVNDLLNVAMTFMGKGMAGDVIYPLQQATSFMTCFGNIIFGWLLGEQAMIAHDKLEALCAEKGAATPEAKRALVTEHADAGFYDGKVKTATFFGKNLLPENRWLNQAMLSEDTTIMDVVL